VISEDVGQYSKNTAMNSIVLKIKGLIIYFATKNPKGNFVRKLAFTVYSSPFDIYSSSFPAQFSASAVASC